jgi:HEAT repeat protein
MTMNVDALRARIDLDEIDYPGLARELGPEALPALAEIAQDPNPGLAAKAVYLASEIAGEDAVGIARQASVHPEPTLRLAAAAAMRNLADPSVEPSVAALLDDGDPGVRKLALRSAAAIEAPGLRQRIAEMAEADPDPGVRAVARGVQP